MPYDTKTKIRKYKKGTIGYDIEAYLIEYKNSDNFSKRLKENIAYLEEFKWEQINKEIELEKKGFKNIGYDIRNKKTGQLATIIKGKGNIAGEFTIKKPDGKKEVITYSEINDWEIV